VDAVRNAHAPISHVDIQVEYEADNAVGTLEVMLDGDQTTINLQPGGGRSTGWLGFTTPVPAQGGPVHTFGFRVHAAPWRPIRVRPWWWPGMGAIDPSPGVLEDPPFRLRVRRVVMTYRNVMGLALRKAYTFGDRLSCDREQPDAEAPAEPMEVPVPTFDPTLDPLYRHVNQNKSHYMGALLERALVEPGLRVDCPHVMRFPSSHPIWRMPILGFEGHRLIYVADPVTTDPDPAKNDAFAAELMNDKGAATIIQVASKGSYGEALQGILELTDLKGKIPPALQRALYVVPLGSQILDPDTAGQAASQPAASVTAPQQGAANAAPAPANGTVPSGLPPVPINLP
jgi:hypothetical protein